LRYQAAVKSISYRQTLPILQKRHIIGSLHRWLHIGDQDYRTD